MAESTLSRLIEESRAALAIADSGLTSAQRAARRMSLAEFVQAAWPIIEPATPLIWGWPLQAIADHVQALLEGRLARNNLMVFVPPGSAKSTIVSVCCPAWMWVTRPAWRSIFASGNPAVATRDSQRCRMVLTSAWYRTVFGITWELAADANLKTRFQNTATGVRLALSSQAKVTGDRADALFIDDALDADDAYSELVRDATNQWWDQAYANRLNDLSRGTRCLIQQRLHTADLPGHILSREADQWEVLCIPQLWEESRRTRTSLGWTDPRKADGELMFPERFPAHVVDSEKLRLGESGFAGQHQQRPYTASGEVFKTGCLQLWESELPVFKRTIVSLDCAFKLKETSDFSVAVMLGQFDRGVMLIDVVRGRYSYPTLREIVMQLCERWRPSAVLIEDAASGQSLIQELSSGSALPVKPVRPDGDKLARAHTVVPSWEAHRVFAPKGAPWLAEFLEELHAFPKAPHDDQVDAFAQGARYLLQQRTGIIQESQLLVDGAPLALPAFSDSVFAVVGTSLTGDVGVVYFSHAVHSTHPIVIVGWCLEPFEASPAWVRGVFETLANFQKTCRAQRIAGVWFDGRAPLGAALLRIARDGNWKGQVFDHVERLARENISLPDLPSRVVAALRFVSCGDVKIAAPAFEHESSYRGTCWNHLLGQIAGFGLEQAQQPPQATELLDAFAMGCVVARQGAKERLPGPEPAAQASVAADAPTHAAAPSPLPKPPGLLLTVGWHTIDGERIEVKPPTDNPGATHIWWPCKVGGHIIDDKIALAANPAAAVALQVRGLQ